MSRYTSYYRPQRDISVFTLAIDGVLVMLAVLIWFLVFLGMAIGLNY